jgi:hypothetical protein
MVGLDAETVSVGVGLTVIVTVFCAAAHPDALLAFNV